ncbi:hypothetical protein WJX73_004674 [Symbiochloris irregularis]|uniref:APAF-1 helical domain-containing protein n=1 Tax=Symbiochloris irregularis TaxID=706552 RepID=A0AAW1PMV2_9CHLO
MPGGWGSAAKGWLKKKSSSLNADRGTGSLRSQDSDAAMGSHTTADSRERATLAGASSIGGGQPCLPATQEAAPATGKGRDSTKQVSNDSAYVSGPTRDTMVQSEASQASVKPSGHREEKSASTAQPPSGSTLSRNPSQQIPASPTHHETKPPSARGNLSTEDSMAISSTPMSPTNRSVSQRSSFMLQRASRESNRASLDMFGRISDRGSLEGSDSSTASRIAMSMPDTSSPSHTLPQLQAAAAKAGVPERLWNCYLALVVVPPSTPLPATMLQLLWDTQDPTEAEGIANDLAQVGVLRVAHLEDGSTWTLPQPDHMAMLQAHPPKDLPALHGALIDSYLSYSGVSKLKDLQDDGYILQSLGHHLIWANRLADLKELLSDPDWLEVKLHGYGTINVVADFRRYLMANADDDVKLMLDAYQMSVSACLQHPGVSLLRSQMVARLTAVRPHAFKERQVLPAPTDEQGGQKVRALRLKGMSMEQAGGLQRMTLRGHTAGLQKVLLSPSGIDVITASQDCTARVWDMEIGDCVLVMEGHTGPITSIALAGQLLLTSSQDSTVRVWDMEHGKCLHVLSGHTAAVNDVAVARDGKTAISVSSDETARIWNMMNGRCRHVIPGRQSGQMKGVLWCVALSDDDKYAVTGSEDFNARIWQMSTGNCMRVMSGHKGWIMAVVVTPDNNRVLTASHDGTARVWSFRSGRCVHVLEGHSGRITTIKIAANSTTAMTAADDNTARVWDIETGACRHVLEGHSSWVSDAALTASGSLGITCSGDELAVAWDLSDGSFLRVLDGHCGEICSAVLTERGRFAVTASEDSTARVWDLQTQPLPALQRHSTRVHAIAPSTGGTTVTTLGGDGLMVWELATGKLKREIDAEGGNMRYLAVSEDGQRALIASANSAMAVYDLETGTCTASKPASPGSRVRSFDATVDLRLAVIVLFDSSIVVWDVASMSQACVLQSRGKRDAEFGHSSGVNDVALSRHGRLVVTVAKDETARVWDAESGAGQLVLRGHTSSVTGVSISPNDACVATSSVDGTARVWNLETGTCLAVLSHGSPVTHAVFSRDSTCIVTCASGCEPYMWDVGTSSRIHKLDSHRNPVTDIAFCEDSSLLATCSKDSSLCVWNTSEGTLEAVFVADGALMCCAVVGGPGDEYFVAGSEAGAVHILEL